MSEIEIRLEDYEGNDVVSIDCINNDECIKLKEKIISALKLQELVMERLPLLTKSMNEFKDMITTEYNFQRAKVEILTDLLKESEQ